LRFLVKTTTFARLPHDGITMTSATRAAVFPHASGAYSAASRSPVTTVVLVLVLCLFLDLSPALARLEIRNQKNYFYLFFFPSFFLRPQTRAPKKKQKDQSCLAFVFSFGMTFTSSLFVPRARQEHPFKLPFEKKGVGPGGTIRHDRLSG